MKTLKRKKLEAAGYKVGSVDEFLADVVGARKKRKRKPRPLSPTQVKMLTNVRDGRDAFDHCRSMSAYGGADGTWRSLVRLGYLKWVDNDLVITAAGRTVLKEIGVL